jgi:hypothetical protein
MENNTQEPELTTEARKVPFPVCDKPLSASSAPSGYYVANASAGSPTTQLKKIELNIGGTSYNLLAM